MANETQLNLEINNLFSAYETEINPELQLEISDMNIGAILEGKYIVEDYLDVKSGEADLYICSELNSNNNTKYVAKIYGKEHAIKQDVIDKLKAIESPYVAKIFDSFLYNGATVDIIPYYKNGSLQGRKFSKEELLETIIPDINEGLKAIHEADIIHKDLKPSNIMLCDDGKHVSIIDFGISSTADDGSTVILTKTGMTPQYSAPETFNSLFLRESDYYSFGITLFELFTGYVPYANMGGEEIEKYISIQKLPFPEDMPDLLKDLISALTYSNITERRNKDNPNRRWTYEEVNRWLDGEELPIPGEGLNNYSDGSMPPYVFLGETYTNQVEFVEALSKNWEQGKMQLFRGLLSKHYRSFNPEHEKICNEAERELTTTNGKEDFIYWKALSKLNPQRNAFYWKGRMYESLPALGSVLLELLWARKEEELGYFGEILNDRMLSEYVLLTTPDNEKALEIAGALEDAYKIECQEHKPHYITYYRMGYMLSGQKLFYLKGTKYRTVGELAKYMESLLEKSKDDFIELCRHLVYSDGSLNYQLEVWLQIIGKSKELESWKNLLR